MFTRIEFKENDNYGLNITIIGVGKYGEKAVSNYKPSTNTENNHIIRTISYGYVDNFKVYDQMIFDSIKNSEWFFVIGDSNENTDIKIALQLAHIQRQNLDISPFSVFIDISKNCLHDIELAKSFNTIISINDVSMAMKPVEMLTFNMYKGLCSCVDPADIRYMLNATQNVAFQETKTNNLKTILELIFKIKETFKIFKGDIEVLLHISYPYNLSDELYDELCFGDIVNILVKEIPNINLMMQWNDFENKSDTVTWSWIFGNKENLTR